MKDLKYFLHLENFEKKYRYYQHQSKNIDS